MFTFGHCPNQGGGGAPARIFWPFFHSVVGPKVNQFLLKSHNIFKKEDQVARIRGMGGGLGDSGNAQKKTFFSC